MVQMNMLEGMILHKLCTPFSNEYENANNLTNIEFIAFEYYYYYYYDYTQYYGGK